MAHILVVDDELGIRELLSEILYDEGHTVILAENAHEARQHRQQQTHIDLILLDIWMPDTDGITLLKEWLSLGLQHIPVIMMSGHATIDTAVEATRIGALDFLEKPITMQKLLKAIETGLQAAQQMRQKHKTQMNAAQLAMNNPNLNPQLNPQTLNPAGAGMMSQHDAASLAYAQALQAQHAQQGYPNVNYPMMSAHPQHPQHYSNDLNTMAMMVNNGYAPHLHPMHHPANHPMMNQVPLGYANTMPPTLQQNVPHAGAGGLPPNMMHYGHAAPPTAATGGGLANFSFDRPLRDARDEFEKRYFEYLLEQENGSMTRVAERAGLERTHLYRKLKQLNLEVGKPYLRKKNPQ
jgi:DNA-binding NtrC family response regulator